MKKYLFLLASLLTRLCVLAYDRDMIDYYTGKIFTVDESELDNYAATIDISSDDLGYTVEFNTRYAEIGRWAGGGQIICPIGVAYSHYYAKNNIVVPGVAPNLHGLSKSELNQLGFNHIKATILESEFYELGPFETPIALNPHPWGEPDLVITPYVGYQPEELSYVTISDEHGYYTENPFDNKAKRWYFAFYVFQYNHEESTRRAYNHIKARFDFVNEVAHINTVEQLTPTNIQYYNIQGIEINSPKTGQPYIERKGTSYKLKIK